MEQRRIVGLCFKCGEKYTPEHQYRRQLLLLEGGDEEEDGEKEMMEREEDEEDGGAISLHAIKGVSNNKIIKVEGKVQDNCLLILIDSGSTHNFIDEGTVRRMKYPTASTLSLLATVRRGVGY